MADRALLKVMAHEGRHKLSELYVVMERPNRDVPVFIVRQEDVKGQKRTLHRNNLLPNYLLPISLLPIIQDRPVVADQKVVAPRKDSGKYKVQGTERTLYIDIADRSCDDSTLYKVAIDVAE